MNLTYKLHGSDQNSAIDKFKSRFAKSELIVGDYSSDAALNFISEYQPDVIAVLVSQTGTSDSNDRIKFYHNENCSNF